MAGGGLRASGHIRYRDPRIFYSLPVKSGDNMDENARFIAKYEAKGEDVVRSELAQGIISGRGIIPAQEYLRRIDASREIQERTARAEAQAEQSELARRAAASAEQAAVAARAQAEAAKEANTLARRAIEKAQTANTIATLALVAALIVLVVSAIVGLIS